ncbi:hypothetical protein [Sandarakinorhabdus sp.]|uniref:hypothetical protein n=1 Tax=Sandarakinorhabdus sp. TaxID=1916663 RepID=UPI00286E7E75|nr:hypothetical protein [Sandarakinorhabdus sp.]
MNLTTHTIRKAGWGLAAGPLLLPALAMAFTDEMNWGPLDFGAAALLLGGIGLGLEGVARLQGRARLALAIAALAAGFLIWVELAVGIVGPG